MGVEEIESGRLRSGLSRPGYDFLLITEESNKPSEKTEEDLMKSTREMITDKVIERETKNPTS